MSRQSSQTIPAATDKGETDVTGKKTPGVTTLPATDAENGDHHENGKPAGAAVSDHAEEGDKALDDKVTPVPDKHDKDDDADDADDNEPYEDDEAEDDSREAPEAADEKAKVRCGPTQLVVEQLMMKL